MTKCVSLEEELKQNKEELEASNRQISMLKKLLFERNISSDTEVKYWKYAYKEMDGKREALQNQNEVLEKQVAELKDSKPKKEAVLDRMVNVYRKRDIASMQERINSRLASGFLIESITNGKDCTIVQFIENERRKMFGL